MDKTIKLVGNAHLDPIWLWRWQEGCAEVLQTFRSALDRLKEYNDFVFTFNVFFPCHRVNFFSCFLDLLSHAEGIFILSALHFILCISFYKSVKLWTVIDRIRRPA